MTGVPAPGEMLGAYRLVRVLGCGGMGIVHEAWDTRLDRRVALKLLHPHLLQNANAQARFEREARKSARIEHPNVVRIYRVDRLEQGTAIEMQFVDGTPLSTLLRSGPLHPAQAANLLRQLLEALQACHDQGIVHCDLKPGNLVIDRAEHLMLTDFGIARALYDGGLDDEAPDPVSGPLWGTPQYTPPEAWRGGPVSPTWDLFAAGVLVYEALTGTAPFHGSTPLATMNAILSTTLPSLKSLRADISAEFSDLIDCLVARDAQVRTSSAATALETLRGTPESCPCSSDTAEIERPRLPAALPDSPPFLPASRGASPWERWGAALSVLAPVALGLLMIVLASSTARKADTALGGAVPHPNDPMASELFVVGNEVIFAADDGVHGREPWFVDLHSNTSMVQDLAPGPDSSNPRHFRMRGLGNFVFSASTPVSGEELWLGSVSSGVCTVELIKDIIPGPMGSEPIAVGSSDALILFYATTLTAGRELWCTNAVSEQQTSMVSDLYAGVHSSLPMAPTVLPDAQGAYIVAYADAVRGVMLFRYDYATNAIRTLVDVEDGAGAMTKLGTSLIFANSDSVHGWELWNYEENTGKFGLLIDLEPGSDSAGPSQFFTWRERVLFQASTEESGKELWITDGTAAGTQLLSDINPGPHDSDPYGFVTAGDHVFFRAKDDTCGQELWVTDGTPSGTRRVTDLMPGSGSGDPYNLVAGGQGLFFSADDGHTGEELWWTRHLDGEWETEQVVDLYPGPESSEPTGLQFTTGGRGYFLARSPVEGRTVFTFFPGSVEGQERVIPVKMTLEDP